MPMLVFSKNVITTGIIPSVTMSLKAIPTLLMPAISPEQKQAHQIAKQAKVRDLWLVATIVIACMSSIAACWYFFHQHEILLYQDALSHMRISRSVFDSATPGLAQLGSVWLPLPHVLMWPFIWNDALWHSGLAGSLVSMPCYVITSISLFLAARRLTRSSSASFLGTLLFIFNPNVLYLQSTPLSETVCMATSALAAYFFLCWVQDERLQQLIIAAISTFLATLARYDGWALFFGLFCCIAVVGCMKRQHLRHIQANLVVFSLLGGLGILLWFVWNQLIFGNPLYFQAGLYSSQAQQALELASGNLFSYHNLWQAVRFYTIDASQTSGPVLVVLACAGLLWFVLRHRFSPLTLAALVFFIPFPFYIAALYSGNAIIWVPGANPPGAHVAFYNVRYGAQMVGPLAICVAMLVERVGSLSFSHVRAIGRMSVLGVILAQNLLITSGGVITLQDGQYNYACGPQKSIITYLAQHYRGGNVLQDVYASQFDVSDAGLDFRHVIYEGAGHLWLQALKHPASSVEWIVVNPTNSLDLVASQLKADPTLLSQFRLVVHQSNGILLYHHDGRPPLPTRPAPPVWQGDHYPCSSS